MRIKVIMIFYLAIFANLVSAGWFGYDDFVDCTTSQFDQGPSWEQVHNAKVWLECIKKFPSKDKENQKERVRSAEEKIKKEEKIQQYFRENADNPKVKKFMQQEREEQEIESKRIFDAVKKKSEYLNK